MVIVANIARPRTSRLERAESVLKNLVSSVKNIHVRELVVDRSGLTVRRTFAETHLPWRDIAQVGMLQPERGALNPRLPAGHQYIRADVLVVRLRPEVPVPSVFSVLSNEHQQLGYLGLCTVKELGSSSQEMASALERFAGGKLVHGSRHACDAWTQTWRSTCCRRL
ncbi:MAG: PH domain-containing protein [Pseudonocardiaceae bacterium]